MFAGMSPSKNFGRMKTLAGVVEISEAFDSWPPFLADADTVLQTWIPSYHV